MKRPRPRRRSFPRKIYTQNCRGLKTDTKLTELIHSAWRQDAFAVCVQDTWRCAQDFEEENGWTFIGYGPAHQHGRGSRGVGILLNPVATAAWRRADGGVVYRESDRMIAIRVEARDSFDKKRRPNLFILSGYAPTSADSEAEWTAYYDAFARAISHMQPGDVLVAGCICECSYRKGLARKW